MQFKLAASLCVAMSVALGFTFFPVQSPAISEKVNVSNLDRAVRDLINACYDDKFMLKPNEIGNANICDHAIDVVNVLCHLGKNSELSSCKSQNLIKYNQ